MHQLVSNSNLKRKGDECDLLPNVGAKLWVGSHSRMSESVTAAARTKKRGDAHPQKSNSANHSKKNTTSSQPGLVFGHCALLYGKTFTDSSPAFTALHCRHDQILLIQSMYYPSIPPPPSPPPSPTYSCFQNRKHRFTGCRTEPFLLTLLYSGKNVDVILFFPRDTYMSGILTFIWFHAPSKLYFFLPRPQHFLLYALGYGVRTKFYLTR